MTGNLIVEWHDSFSVGVKLVDEQHQKLIAFTNKLFGSCMSGNERTKTDSIFLSVLHEVVDYADYHFSTEEKIMQRINFPDYNMHKHEHVEFGKEVLIKLEEFKFGKINTALSFVYYLRDWVLHHIAVSDKKLGSYLLELKRSGSLEQMVVKVKRDPETDNLQVM